VSAGFGAAEIEAMLAEVGEPVSVTDSTGTIVCGSGIVNEADVDRLAIADVAMAGHEIEVTVRTAGFPGLVAGATLNRDGVDYRVVQVRQLDDGALLRAWCARKT